MVSIAIIAAAVLTVVQSVQSTTYASVSRRVTIEEMGAYADMHTSTACNSYYVGPYPACFDESIEAIGNVDYLPGANEITWPVDGSAWGRHLTGPYPDGVTYLLSWYTGDSKVGPSDTLAQPDTSKAVTQARLSTKYQGPWATPINGKVITYKRAYTPASNLSNYSYLSPIINHVVLRSLKPATVYYYQVWSTITQQWSATYSFKTVKMGYPVQIALMADVGQTVNSTATRDHIIANKPDVIIQPGDFTYSDNYNADNWTLPGAGDGTNQKRWDSWSVLWEPLLSNTPLLGCAGNHELETSGINALVAYNVTNFSYPTNYPFQAYSARWPVAGTTDDFGNINNNMYYSTIIAGQVKLITLNNYIAFQPGSPQYVWAVAEFAQVDRKATPWLVVQFHAAPYHTYVSHYKEMECFMSIYEDIFYKYGVDLVFNGHMHAYERTHPIYKYKIDTCGPIYITIGDGGNVEGPVRNFVDEIDPATNMTYCEGLTTAGATPNNLTVTNPSGWGPDYQRQAHAPGCPTLSWQPANAVGGGPVLVPKDGDPSVGFCQSSQPDWSAYRDPSFGHAILTITSSTSATVKWYRNVDAHAQVSDMTVLKRKTCGSKEKFANQRRARSL